MRYSSLAMTVLLLTTACFGETSVSDLISKTLRDDLNWTDNFSVEYFWTGGENYAFISSNETEFFLLSVNETNASVISDNTTVGFILNARLQSLQTDTVNEIIGDVIAFNESREGEKRCNTWLGLDRALCIDNESCLRSCVYSQPLCLPTYQGFGTPFLSAMASYSKSVLIMDPSVTAFVRSMRLFGFRNSTYLPNETALLEIKKQVGLIQDNPLFKDYSASSPEEGFEFCSPIPYRVDSLDSAISKLRLLRTRLSSDNTTNETMNRILNETAVRMSEVESEKQRGRAFLETIRKNAIVEYGRVLSEAENSSLAVVDEVLDSMVSHLNESLERLNSVDDANDAVLEYSAFLNETESIRARISKTIMEFDTIVTLNNLCSSSLTEAEANVTSKEGRAILDGLMARKERANSLMGPPANAKYLGSVKADLQSVKAQVDALLKEEKPDDSGEGIDFMLLGLGAIVVLVIGVGAYVVKSGKIKLKLPGAEKKPKPAEPPVSQVKQEQAGAVKPKEEGQAPAAEQARTPQTPLQKPAEPQQIPVTQFRVKIGMRGGAYRTKIRTIVRDKNGKPVPDGTVVAFRADSGNITPSAVTKDGVVFASMVFDKKPEHATIHAKALGLERIVKITFV